MRETIRYGIVFVVSVGMIATFHAVLLEALKGDKAIMVLAAVFWIVVVVGALIIDGRTQRERSRQD